MAEEKLEFKTPTFTHYTQVINKLSKIEEKLCLLQDFNNKAELIRIARKELLHNFIEMNNQQGMAEINKTLTEKCVTFKAGHDNTETVNITPSTSTVCRSKSLEELVKHLHKWSMEINMKKEEIDKLKLGKEAIPERDSEYDKRIEKLEIEKDLIEDEMLQLIFQNMYDNKKDYEHLISQLEDENNEMDQRLQFSEDKVAYLKQINTALIRENQILKEIKANPLSAQSKMALLDKKIRKISGKRFSMVSDPSNLMEIDKMTISISAEILLDLETEEKLSLDKQSQDSFQLDKPLAWWHTDDSSLHEHVRRIGNNCQEMRVIHMKLNMIKRYVRTHGTKNINRNTLIDPSEGMSQWK